MATQAHCAFCFECLSANFDHRQPLSLGQVEDLWEQYISGKDLDNDAGVGASEEVDEEEDAEMTDVGTSQPSTTAKPAAISRLLNRGTSVGSSSSSLQSTRSQTSSQNSQRNGSGADTPASSTSSKSRSSLLSFARRNRDLSDEYPLFVTWNTITKSGNKSLRGCIGTFEAQELEYGLKSYALTSGFEDVRFQPIPASLLPQLSNHVTLLTNFSQPTKDAMDWTLGTHGIRISFSHHGRRHGATYLPDVAKEQGWTKEETLVSLMRKAGWSGSSRDWIKVWKDGRGELVTYEGKQVGLHYAEWREFRDWAHEHGVKSKALNWEQRRQMTCIES